MQPQSRLRRLPCRTDVDAGSRQPRARSPLWRSQVLLLTSPCATWPHKPAPEHHEFVRAASMTDLPGELMGALTQGLSQFGVSLPPIPSLTGATTPDSTGLPGLGSPGLASPGLTSPGLTSPGLTSPGLTTPGLTSPGLTSPGLASPGLTLAGSDFAWPDTWRDAGSDHSGSGYSGSDADQPRADHARPGQPGSYAGAEHPGRLRPHDRRRRTAHHGRASDQRPGRTGPLQRHLPDPGRSEPRGGAGGTERRAGQRHDERGQPVGRRSGD